jgi:hypothetical protein
MYTQLEGFNLLQLFSLSTGKGNKNTMKRFIDHDEKMMSEKLSHNVKLMKRSLDQVIDQANEL